MAPVRAAGAGPIGLLAVLMGAQRGLTVHVVDRHVDGPKPALVRDLGGIHTCQSCRPRRDTAGHRDDAPAPARSSATCSAAPPPAASVCLLSVTASRTMEIDLGLLNRTTVLDNDATFGAVNANRTHYEMAAQVLAQADRGLLKRLITRRVTPARWREALERRPNDIMVITDFTL
jgi:glucose 1-dehydrogenase